MDGRGFAFVFQGIRCEGASQGFDGSATVLTGVR